VVEPEFEAVVSEPVWSAMFATRPPASTITTATPMTAAAARRLAVAVLIFDA
jgi:hypothetical protein